MPTTLSIRTTYLRGEWWAELEGDPVEVVALGNPGARAETEEAAVEKLRRWLERND